MPDVANCVRKISIALFCFGRARRQYRQAACRFPLTVAHQRSDPYSPRYHQHRARPCRQGHAASCRTRSSDGRSQSWGGLSVAPMSLFAESVRLGQSYDLPDELRLPLCLPAASQDGCQSYAYRNRCRPLRLRPASVPCSAGRHLQMTSFHRIFSRVLDSFFSAPCRLRQQARYQSTRPARFCPTPFRAKSPSDRRSGHHPSFEVDAVDRH
jgi:hypothetical protein